MIERQKQYRNYKGIMYQLSVVIKKKANNDDKTNRKSGNIKV
jgi:hypothetical protein